MEGKTWKFPGNCDVIIVKSCKNTTEAQADERTSPCPSVVPISDEEFLEKIDNEILYVDESIEIERKDVLTPVDLPVDDRSETDFDDVRESSDEENEEFKIQPSKLSSQIRLPLQNFDALSFCEILMISLEAKHVSVDRLVPKYDDNINNGCCCIMAEPLDDGTFLISMSFQMVDGCDSHISYKIVSVVDDRLNLVREEWTHKTWRDKKCLTEKTIRIIGDDDEGFRMTKTITQDDNTEHWQGDLKLNGTGDFLSCGANVLLTRQLVLQKFTGSIQSWMCDFDGVLHLSQHQFHQSEILTVLDTSAQVQRVDRLLISSDGKVSKHSTFFLVDTANVLKEISSLCPCTFHINPFSNLPPRKIANFRENMQDSMELMTKYLDYKANRKDELKLELQQQENSRSRRILRDFVECLVSGKPRSAMNLTLDFIRQLERDGNAPQLFRTSSRRQTSAKLTHV